MIIAEDLKLDHNDEEILHVGSYEPGQSLQMIIEDGNSVSLRKGNIEIEVQNIKQAENGTYYGKVQYVEPYQAL